MILSKLTQAANSLDAIGAFDWVKRPVSIAPFTYISEVRNVKTNTNW